MKNNRFSFIPILGIVLSGVLVSCNKDKADTETTSVLSIGRAEVLTRSSKDVFVQGDQIGIFVFDEANLKYNDCECSWNNKATLETEWILENDIYLGSKSGSVLAYYPYYKSITSPNQIPVESGTQTDYLFSREVIVNDENPVVALQMQHALSLVKFIIKKDNYNGEGKITGISMQGINLEGTLNITTGDIVVNKRGNEAYKGDFTLSDSPLAIGIIALPQAVTSTTVLLSLDGERYGYKLPEGIWEKGKETTYTLGINPIEKKLFQIGSSTIDSWGSGGSYEGNLEPGIDIGTEIV